MKNIATNFSVNQMTGSIGVLISFDNANNTATVGITENETDEIREILKNVPCPVVMGVQTVTPTPGMLCWVQFRGGKITSPLVVNFYNHRYEKHTYENQYKVDYTLPTNLMD